MADSAQEADAARALMDSQRASLTALGQAPPPATPPNAPRGRAPGAVAEFLGTTPAAVTGRLGTPQLRRREADAEVWLYAAGGCQLDLMFYTTPQGLRVMHAQARAGGLGQRTEAACLRDIAAQGSRGAQTPGL